MVTQPKIKYIPISILCCPECTRKKKPFKSFKSLNVHLAKSHPEFPFKIEIVKNENLGKDWKGTEDVIVKTRKSEK